jgi:cytochrome c biogenesis protein CcdA
MNDTTLLPSILAALVAVFAHACFQLAVSVLTLLSGHSLGRQRSHLRVVHLSFSYILGAFTATVGLVCTVAYFLSTLTSAQTYKGWAIVAGLNAGVGLAVLFFYYRKGKGTVLWLPRSAAEALTDRAKKTKSGYEAFGLGLATIIAELPFLIAPVSVVALLVADPMTSLSSFGWMTLYAGLVTLPLFYVAILVSGGHRISTIQRWREANKTFLQVSSGGALIVLGFFLLAKFGLAVQI